MAEAALLMCCGSQGWARRMAEHRPYPDLDALLAAADEAAFDLARDDLAEALAAEAGRPASAQPPFDARGSLAAHIALRAAHAAYEAKFRHVFVICLDGLRTDETLDHTLAAIHARLHHEPDEERGVARDELRRLTRGRLVLASAGRCGDAATPTLLR